jgi:GNAT superfamily N-acetyltransferase
VTRFLARPSPDDAGLPEAVLVAVESDARATLLGFAELSRRAYAEGCETSPVGFLEGWFVVAERRRQGIGRALVSAAEAWARALGAASLPPMPWPTTRSAPAPTARSASTKSP